MSVWAFLEHLFSSFVSALSPVFEYEFGGFTYWQYSLFAFLICSFVRFILPLLSGGSIGASGVISSFSDEVKKSKSDRPNRPPDGVNRSGYFWY